MGIAVYENPDRLNILGDVLSVSETKTGVWAILNTSHVALFKILLNTPNWNNISVALAKSALRTV